MNNWIHFNTYAILSATLWLLGLILISIGHFNKKTKIYTLLGITISSISIAIFAFFIMLLWINLERPPLRTLGETRLWSVFFLSTVGLIVYIRWRYLLQYSLSLIIYGLILLMALGFLILNIIYPEIHEKTLMPALQSPWFVPHVIVYMLAYTFLFVSCVVSFVGLIFLSLNKLDKELIIICDNLVYLGFALLTCGLLFGALWAKTAWGHYWTWDPKETWAFLTWLGYLIYLHFRHYHPLKIKTNLWILGLSFIILLVCWFGINYLPSAQNSVHVYAN